MADAELRALERDVAATGDPAARLSLGQQLVRHGRRDEALRALWPIRGTVEGRRALAEWPATTPGHPDGGCWDTPPLRTRPRVRWQRPVADTFQTRVLLASPLGIACCPDRSRVAVLDPEGGAIRWSRDVSVDDRARPLRVDGERLVVRGPEREEVFDLWSGDCLALEPVAQPPAERRTLEWLLESPAIQVGLENQRDGMADLVLRDRATLVRRTLAGLVHRVGGLVLARDVVFAQIFQDGAAAPGPPGPMAPERSALRAHATDGRLLWELREPDELPVALLCIAPLAGRLYGLGRDGSVLCLEA